MGRFVRVVIRSLILALCLFTWFEHSKIWADPTVPAYANPTAKYGSVWRFLTLQNFFLHIIVNAMMLIGELIEPVKRLAHVLHFGISFAATLVVFLVFWPLYIVNQELILPKRNEVFYPFWLNLVEHGAIAVFALVNCCLERRKSGFYSHAFALILANSGYILWILHIYNHTGKWVYNFLAAVGYDNVLRVVLPLVVTLCGSAAWVGVKINDSLFATTKTKKQ